MNDYIDIEDVAPDRQLQRDRFVDFGANGTRGAVSSSWGPADLALAGSGRRSAPAFPSLSLADPGRTGLRNERKRPRALPIM
jgi:hypothetical protein